MRRIGIHILLVFAVIASGAAGARGQALPNLTPYQPAGWSDKLTVSTMPLRSMIDSVSFTTADTIYVSWAVINEGTASTSARFYTKLYVDGTEIQSWYADPPLDPNRYTYMAGYSIGSLAAGSHTVRIVADSTGAIAESAEYDNEYTKYITVSTASLPNLTPYQPAGWSDKLVVSNVSGSTTDSGSFKTTDTLYISWAVTNIGAGATNRRFYIRLLVDGAEKTSWYFDPPLLAGYYCYIKSYQIGPLGGGGHTVRIVADSTGEVAESNESDNEYSKSITVGTSACFQLTARANISAGGSVSIATASNCSMAAIAQAAESDTPAGAGEASPGVAAAGAASSSSLRSARTVENFRRLGSKAADGRKVRVIVGLECGAESMADAGALAAPASARLSMREAAVKPAQEKFFRAMEPHDLGRVKRLRYSPFVGIEADEAALEALEQMPGVVSIEEDELSRPSLAESTPLIGATAAWAGGYSGAGQTVVILDTGVDGTHPFLSGKVVSEACYSTNGTTSNGAVTSLCPGQASESTADGSGKNCSASVSGCTHGTHVAGIAAGKGSSFSGVAPDANIISIQVYSRFDSAADCDGTAPCVMSYHTDQLLALERVLELSSAYQISSVNMSLGGGVYRSEGHCDWYYPSMKSAIDQLRTHGIATAVASGNEYSSDGIASPACLSSSVSVGSTDDGSGGTAADAVSDYSNSAAILNLLAPGRWIRSSLPGNSWGTYSGTSMAAPHVTGAWAVIKSKFPSATVDQVLEALSLTGVPVADSRNGITKPRIQIDAALDALGGTQSGQFTTASGATVNATPNEGYRVTGWTGCDSYSGNSCTVAMDSNKSVTALFEAITTAPPVIGESSATAVTSTSARLNATVSPNGLSTAVNFHWGTTTAYGSTTSYQIADTSTAAASVSVPVTGLSPSTTYYYQVMASNSSGSASPTAGTFTTLSGAIELPDLVVASFHASTEGTAGGQITINAAIRNDGPANAGIFTAGFYLSPDAVIDAGDINTGYVCNFESGLEAGALETCSGLIGIPSPLAPGTYVLGVIVDDGGSVSESSESNNTRGSDSGPLTIVVGTGVSLDVPAGGAAVTSMAGSSGETRAGYAAVKVSSGSTPYGTAVFSFTQNGIVVSEAGVPASPPTTSARVFIEFRRGAPVLPGRPDSGAVNVNTGIAVVNNGTTAALITYTLRDMSGGTLTEGHGTLAAGKHFACFIDQLKERAAPDFELPPDFASAVQFGSLEISGDRPVSVLALRGTTNQRNEFLITTTPVADLTANPGASSRSFPHFVDGGGYTTSLALLNTSQGVEKGMLQLLDDDGAPLSVTLSDGTTGSSFRYLIPSGGAFRLQTDGSPEETRTGWARLRPDLYNKAPAGSGVFGFSPAGTLVSESGIPAADSTTHARIYVDLSQGHDTGLAIANASAVPAEITLQAFEADGTTAAGGSQGLLRLPGSGHGARFAGEFIDGLPEGFTGVLDIRSASPFAALTLRSLVNGRGDFLMTTFPVADAESDAPSPVVFPQIADGGGYITEFIMISAGEAADTTVYFYDEDGAAFDSTATR